MRVSTSRLVCNPCSRAKVVNKSRQTSTIKVENVNGKRFFLLKKRRIFKKKESCLKVFFEGYQKGFSKKVFSNKVFGKKGSKSFFCEKGFWFFKRCFFGLFSKMCGSTFNNGRTSAHVTNTAPASVQSSSQRVGALEIVTQSSFDGAEHE